MSVRKAGYGSIGIEGVIVPQFDSGYVLIQDIPSSRMEIEILLRFMPHGYGTITKLPHP